MIYKIIVFLVCSLFYFESSAQTFSNSSTSAVNNLGRVKKNTCLVLVNTDGSIAQQWCPDGTGASEIRGSAGNTIIEFSNAGGITSNQSTANNAFKIFVDGARLDLGTGADDYWYANGNVVNTPASVLAGRSFTSGAASGNNAFAAQTSGARFDYGGGASDYATSNGTTVTFAGPLATLGLFTASSGVKPSTDSATISNTYTGTAVIDFAAAGATYSCETSANVTVTGAVLGDRCIPPGISVDMSAIVGQFTCEVKSANIAVVKFCGGSSSDPASATYTVQVVR